MPPKVPYDLQVLRINVESPASICAALNVCKALVMSASALPKTGGDIRKFPVRCSVTQHSIGPSVHATQPT